MKRIVAPLVVIAIIASALLLREKFGTPKISVTAASASENAAGSTKTIPSVKGGTQAKAGKSKVSATVSILGSQAKTGNAQASLNEMSLILRDAVQSSRDMDSLVNRLQQTGQKPSVVRDANSATGDMYVVRTKSPLPGTRYFHAQYFTDENNKRFVQHMSFEFKPSPTALNEAVRAAVQIFSLGEPSMTGKDFIQWSIDDDYVLWIKKKSAQDLKHDPFNAHDPVADVGTVQMAIEMKIDHDGEDHH